MTVRTYPYKPDYAVPPGWILKEELEVLGLPQVEFAQRCGISAELIGEILIGNAPIEYQTAAKFKQVLGGGTKIWLNMEAAYRNKLAELSENEELAEWAKKFPAKELVKRGDIGEFSLQADSMARMLSFFDVWSAGALEDKYAASSVAYRHSPSFQSNPATLATWLRLGEIEAQGMECNDYDRESFLRSLTDVRALTMGLEDGIFGRSQELCRQSGVALCFIEPFKGTAVSGASYWLPGSRPVIQLSARHKTDDHLWFSLFHEAAHILLHSKKQVFIDAIRGKSAEGETEESEVETEADKWASNFLIPRAEWDKFAGAFSDSAVEVQQFAEEQGIAPGIVVGRLQREGILPWNRLNALKRKLTWAEPSD